MPIVPSRSPPAHPKGLNRSRHAPVGWMTWGRFATPGSFFPLALVGTSNGLQFHPPPQISAYRSLQIPHNRPISPISPLCPPAPSNPRTTSTLTPGVLPLCRRCSPTHVLEVCRGTVVGTTRDRPNSPPGGRNSENFPLWFVLPQFISSLLLPSGLGRSYRPFKPNLISELGLPPAQSPDHSPLPHLCTPTLFTLEPSLTNSNNSPHPSCDILTRPYPASYADRTR
jgi:hypothetical protein